MLDLTDRNLIVTGGTSGIGLAVAVQAHAAGAKVQAMGRSEERVDRCAARYPGIRFVSLDTHDAAGLAAWFESIGRIDHIVAAATGAQRTLKPFLEQTEAQFREAFDKFWGYCKVVRAGAPFLSPDGSITLVSGTPARRCDPGMSSLSCTGAAVEALCRALALELVPVRVNVIAPGLIASGMQDHLGDRKEEVLEQMGRGVPLGRVGRADEVASAILQTLTNTYMTGATIDVDGGILLP